VGHLDKVFAARRFWGPFWGFRGGRIEEALIKVLAHGAKQARAIASETVGLARRRMGIGLSG
jgi:hypothetical protein